VYIRKPRPRVHEGDEEFEHVSDDDNDDDDDDDDDDDIDDDADDESSDELLQRIARAANQKFALPRRQRKSRAKNGESAAARKRAIKAANAARTEGYAQLSALPPNQLVFVPGTHLSGSCNGVGIPFISHHNQIHNPHFQDGVIVLLADADNVRFLAAERDRKLQAEFERRQRLNDATFAENAARRTRLAERAAAIRGDYDCDAFRQALAAHGVELVSLVGKTVQRIAGKACIDLASSDPPVAAAAAERVSAAFRLVGDNMARLGAVLERCEIPLLPLGELSADMREMLITALESDEVGQVLFAVHELASRFASSASENVSWRAHVAALCGPCFELKTNERGAELSALLEADDSGVFEIDEGIVSIAGYDDFEIVGRRAQAKFDRVLEERSVVGPLPGHLEEIRRGLGDRAAEQQRLNSMTIAQLRSLARERGCNVTGLTLKEEMAKKIMDKFVHLGADERFDMLLCDPMLRVVLNGCATMRHFLDAHGAVDLLPKAVEFFHSSRALEPTEDVTETATNCAIKAIRWHRHALFDRFAPSEAETHNWAGARVRSKIIEQAREMLGSAESIVGFSHSPAEIVESTLAEAEEALVGWMELERVKRIEHRKRKAVMDDLLGGIGLMADAATPTLWHPLLAANKVALRAPPALYGVDVPVLNSVVEDDSADVQLPPIIGMRLLRRTMLLDALRRAGVSNEAAIPMHVESATVLHTFLMGSRVVRSREAAGRYVGDVNAAESAGDVFLCLPMLVVFNICERLAPDDLINVASVSDTFGISAAVWAVNSKRHQSAISHRPAPMIWQRRRGRRRWEE
jgi:hypothetical protein